LAVKGTYVQVCGALAVQRRAEITKLFLISLRYSPPGDGRAYRRRMQESNLTKFEISKIPKSKTKTFENSCRKFVLFSTRSDSFSLDQRQEFRLFASLSPLLHSNCARCIFNDSKQCPMKRRHLLG
jgi:hypothetical protein